MYKDILDSILKVYNLNASELAERIDVQRSGISHIMSGRNKPSIDFLVKVKNEFPGIQWDYLIKGEKPMLVTDVNKMKNDVKTTSEEPTLFNSNDNLDKNEQDIKKPHVIKKIVWFYDDNSFEVFYPG